MAVADSDTALESFLDLERRFEAFVRVVPIAPEHHRVHSPILASILLDACSLLETVLKSTMDNARYNAINNIANIRLMRYSDVPPFLNIGHLRAVYRSDMFYVKPVWYLPRGEASFPWYVWRSPQGQPRWWNAYNAVKHSRFQNANQATLLTTLHALKALFLSLVQSLEFRERLVVRGWIRCSMVRINHLLAHGIDWEPIPVLWQEPVVATSALFGYKYLTQGSPTRATDPTSSSRAIWPYDADRTFRQVDMKTIFTLNARSNVFLDVLRDHFQIPAVRMRKEITGMHRRVVDVLSAKGIRYSDLRSGLVPRMDRHEAAFIFDSQEVSSGYYGPEAIGRLLPLLEPNSTQSILVGDLIAESHHQSLVVEILRESMVLSRGFTFRHSTLLYAVYLNNLSEVAVKRVHEALATWPAYLGFIPTTFASRAKLFLSTTLATFVLKHRKVLILGHEDDRPNTENINITFYPLEDAGHRVVSLQGLYFTLFLGYKIERPVLQERDSDAELSLNAISNEVVLFDDFRVDLDERKFQYLLTEKFGKLRKAGLDEADRQQICKLIQSQLSANYIYNLCYREEHNVITFNLMLEVPRDGGYPTRVTAVLEYLPDTRVLRVVTMH